MAAFSPFGLRMVRLIGWSIVALALLAACSPGRRANDGPRLLQDSTLAPASLEPTRAVTVTPSPLFIPVVTSVESGLTPLATVRPGFSLVTPTLPPSKTPTVTPTLTATRTTVPPSPTAVIFVPSLVFPTVGFIPPTPLPGATSGVPLACGSPWFFSEPIPATCPLNPPLITNGAIHQFQNGFMIWVQQQDGIYVLFDSANLPRWQVLNDLFVDGMPEIDPAFNNPPPYTWQPRRGFGLLWRTDFTLQQRLGWAVSEYETPYTIQVQTGADGTIYMNDARGGVFMLSSGGQDWQRYESRGGF
ncbi:MAG: hypothetical protein K8I60_10345 [Anaerolineae bacterium]|nr:hypothetical protein [Anaerolineae bacterium]